MIWAEVGLQGCNVEVTTSRMGTGDGWRVGAHRWGAGDKPVEVKVGAV